MKDNYYLDNAATTLPKPESVYQFMDSFYRSHGVNPGRAGHVLAVEAETMIVETRRMLAQFFGFSGDPNRVVFTQNATDSMNTALSGTLVPGDHLIITRTEHNSVLRPANHLERDRDVRVTRLSRDEQGYIDPNELRDAIGPKTRAVVINHGSNVLGAVQDLEEIGRIVGETDAMLIVDTCQTAGVIAIDMDRLGIDVLVFTGHKGLFGPMGIGGLLVREGIEIASPRFGGTGVDSITPFQPDTYPHRLEAGTVSIPGIAGLHAAQKWFAEVGRAQDPTQTEHAGACCAALAHIETVERGHIVALSEGLKAIDGVKVYGPNGNQRRVATMTFNIDGVPADQIGAMLDADYAICARAGLHCAPLVHEDEGTVAQNGSVRLSPGYFTDEEDIAHVIESVEELAGMYVE
ncbi:MAG: aminotransferase class V-fold PLP-dependent enzyme [Rhodospirillaceae bacterium]|jgi:cysteine desulfurase / selenocysteine lyase|nr:aminotransferase class V-fold PLP-dependent enzyme [Rhodospirillaceae bacterium]MBT6136620.1 aminotransferase class V-fold PLP-dependent enzyme [Rhodospirillaceae bacterium]